MSSRRDNIRAGVEARGKTTTHYVIRFEDAKGEGSRPYQYPTLEEARAAAVRNYLAPTWRPTWIEGVTTTVETFDLAAPPRDAKGVTT